MFLQSTVFFFFAVQTASVGPELAPFEHEAQAGYDASQLEPIDSDVISSPGYLGAHPDQRYRLYGNRARINGQHEDALRYFQRAARYADKLSQGAIAEMYWNGEGVARDRAVAYAWMDLAAERGSLLLLAHRETYWSELTPTERARALQVGSGLYAEYGDEAAKPRLERILVTARRKVTGSRTGWVGNLSLCMDYPACSVQLTGEQYYADRYWRPNKYWEWQDRLILTPGPEGKVDVGPLGALEPNPETQD